MRPIEKKVKALCRKFYDDIQEIFDGLTDDKDIDAYEGEIMQAALSNQGYAEDAMEAE